MRIRYLAFAVMCCVAAFDARAASDDNSSALENLDRVPGMQTYKRARQHLEEMQESANQSVDNANIISGHISQQRRVLSELAKEGFDPVCGARPLLAKDLMRVDAVDGRIEFEQVMEAELV